MDLLELVQVVISHESFLKQEPSIETNSASESNDVESSDVDSSIVESSDSKIGFMPSANMATVQESPFRFGDRVHITVLTSDKRSVHAVWRPGYQEWIPVGGGLVEEWWLKWKTWQSDVHVWCLEVDEWWLYCRENQMVHGGLVVKGRELMKFESHMNVGGGLVEDFHIEPSTARGMPIRRLPCDIGFFENWWRRVEVCWSLLETPCYNVDLVAECWKKKARERMMHAKVAMI
ncbi:hypothetical protein MAR_007257 [Mya arenaria]|uniref:Uncharacterized protein n=1 Tax=Mya arenaria TaxID=6604 RepID=A0ABY7DAT3_MYAAR|nr:hypothetical protein MAR_007257 [Mya arenaria]